MLTRYRPRTFALELLMIVVALLFAYPVYVLVNLILKNPHEIAEASIGPALAPRDLELLERLERRAPRRRDDQLDDHHGGQPRLPDRVGSTAAYYLARTQSQLSYGMYLLFLLGHRPALPARARARSTGS